ncbi:hypothetical protein EJ110_NYTH23670 [Nymphaea thermarum]|nr:hypothetical protein EJ110_NYTH23670 [Nymphaea thermarum]
MGVLRCKEFQRDLLVTQNETRRDKDDHVLPPPPPSPLQNWAIVALLKVYDVTQFLEDHPGGHDVLLSAIDPTRLEGPAKRAGLGLGMGDLARWFSAVDKVLSAP